MGGREREREIKGGTGKTKAEHMFCLYICLFLAKGIGRKEK